MHSATISVIDVLISEPRVQPSDPVICTSERRHTHQPEFKCEQSVWQTGVVCWRIIPPSMEHASVSAVFVTGRCPNPDKSTPCPNILLLYNRFLILSFHEIASLQLVAFFWFFV
jgi:hypothetical protein